MHLDCLETSIHDARIDNPCTYSIVSLKRILEIRQFLIGVKRIDVLIVLVTQSDLHLLGFTGSYA